MSERREVRQEPSDAEIPWIRDFNGPGYELRRLFAEALGTFFYALVTIGATLVDLKSRGSVTLDAQAAAQGLVVMAVVYSIGSVSGAHVNPAITFSYALRRNFPWRRLPGYWCAQFVGAVIAVYFLRYTLGNLGHLGASAPAPGITNLTAFLFEVVLTLGFVTVTLGTASGQNNVGPNAAIARGGYIALAVLWAGPISEASMNPMRSLAPALIADDWSHLWIYLVGPFTGAAIAVGFAWILRGPPTLAATRASQGEDPAQEST